MKILTKRSVFSFLKINQKIKRWKNRLRVILENFIAKFHNYKNKLSQILKQRFAKNNFKFLLRAFSQNFFVIRHAGLIILALFILVGNLIIAKSMPIEEEFVSVISLSGSVAVSETELVETIKVLSVFTPNLKENPQKIAERLIEKDKLVMVDGGYVAKPSVLGTSSVDSDKSSTSPVRKKGIFIYTVKSGDTIAKIANKFSISVSTIKSTNSLSSDIIKPGQKLHIPSADGVIHTVAKGETLIRIVSKYSGDLNKTLSENNLGINTTIYAGQKIVIVEGKYPAPTTRLAKKTTQQTSYGIKVRGGSCGNRFPFGWCTWWVAQKRCVPWRGNARAWPYQARRYGYQVGRVPAVGAIMVTNESWWGHVAVVEAVHGSSVTISEMNFARWGRVNRRTLPAYYGIYIY